MDSKKKNVFLYHPFISPSGLENLRSYAYHGVDNSFCGRLFLNSFWESTIKLMPTWIAPNVITLTGGIFCFIATVLAMFNTPTFTETVPRWACFIYAICIFLYQTMDNLDGKQARRTGSGSPLGELFDHGVDSLVLGMFVIIVSAVMRAGGFATVLIGALMMAPFYMSHWEEYHAGVLVLGEFTGPTEMQVGVMLVLVVVGLFGTGWYQPIVPYFLLAIMGYAFSLAGYYFYSVYKMVKEKKSIHPVPDYFTALKQVLPYFGWISLCLIWIVTTRETVDAYPTWYFVAITLAFGAVTQQLIAQLICSEPIKFNYYIYIPYGIAALYGLLTYAGIGKYIGGVYVLIFVLFTSLFFEALFVNSIIHQLAEFLEIRPFVISTKQSK